LPSGGVRIASAATWFGPATYRCRNPPRFRHVVSALAGPRVVWWWTQPLLGVAELVLGVWAVRSYQRSLLTLVTLVGVWAIFHGVSEIFAAFSLREATRRVEQLVD
jgi:uncharacterized membrane protein HdeD (DUF308 family)